MLICGFFFFNSEEIIHLIGGAEYIGAVVPLKIMMLYPIHQTYGRFTAGLITAMEETKLFRNITIITSIISLILVITFVAPNNFIKIGLGLGSIGLALKTVILQIIYVNILLFYCCRLINAPLKHYLSNQFLTIIPIFCIGIIVDFVIGLLGDNKMSSIENIFLILLFGAVYAISLFFVTWVFPAAVGLSKQDYEGIVSRIRHISANSLFKNSL